MDAIETIKSELETLRAAEKRYEAALAALTGAVPAKVAEPVKPAATPAKNGKRVAKKAGKKAPAKRVELEPVNAQTRQMVLDELSASERVGGLTVNAEDIRRSLQTKSGRMVKSLANVLAAMKRDGQVVASGKGRAVVYSLPEAAE